jgi:peptidylprolyl isomerase
MQRRKFFFGGLTGLAANAALRSSAASKETMTYSDGRSGDRLDDLDNVILLDLTNSRTIIRLFPRLAPRHVARLKFLVRGRCYDGVSFSRIVDGLLAQTGTPKIPTAESAGLLPELDPEISPLRRFRRATCGMTTDDRLFLMFNPAPSMDGLYTITGRVERGMNNVDSLQRFSQRPGYVAAPPDCIVRMRIGSDWFQEMNASDRACLAEDKS